jgi:hypothetical protein
MAPLAGYGGASGAIGREGARVTVTPVAPVTREARGGGSARRTRLGTAPPLPLVR